MVSDFDNGRAHLTVDTRCDSHLISLHIEDLIVLVEEPNAEHDHLFIIDLQDPSVRRERNPEAVEGDLVDHIVDLGSDWAKFVLVVRNTFEKVVGL